MRLSDPYNPLRLRQYPLYSKKAPPPALKEHFTDDVFQKSQAYGKDKARFSLFSGLFKQVLDSVFLHYGIYAWAWTVAGNLIAKLGYGEEYEVRLLFLSRAFWSLNQSVQITQSIAFACVLVFVSTIPSLPLSIYQTFVLEERHGFNTTTPGLFVADLLKGWAIGFVIGAPFLGAFLYVFKWAGDRFVPWLMAFL